MKPMFLVSVAAMTLSLSGALAQNAPAPAPSSVSASDSQFIDKQATGEFRAPKLVGVAVYDSANKSVGKVSDLMLDKEGAVKAVVISVGGFLGIGSKYVAVPFSSVHWQTEQRTVATNPGAAPAGDSNGMGSTQGNMTANGSSATAPATGAAPADQNRTATIDATQAATYQGYPDRAVIDLTQDQLKSAPEFKYASVPASAAATTGSGAMSESNHNSSMKP